MNAHWLECCCFSRSHSSTLSCPLIFQWHLRRLTSFHADRGFISWRDDCRKCCYSLSSKRASRYQGLTSALLTDKQREISILSETETNVMLKLINRVHPLAALDFWVYTGSSLTLTWMRYLRDWQWFILISVNKVI